MSLTNHPPQRIIEASHLVDWKNIGSGGFGEVFRARHSQWRSNVAVKLLRVDDPKALLREIQMMCRGSSPFVIHVHGIIEGKLPFCQQSMQLGLVMEFMERGSLSSLQQTLDEPPPWPLVIRLAHQVALGINFLHSLKPPMLHLDLKPSNVLLDPALNAKLTDFGLSMFYLSRTQLSSQDTAEKGGTLPYLPPEALNNLSYKPSQATDIYSYSILLWSIVTGKKPYEYVHSHTIKDLVLKGQRPSLEEFMARGSGLAGLEQLKDLMVKCWAGDREQRPSSRECTTVTEELHKMHKHAIVDVVHEVLKKLDQKEQEDGQPDQVERVPERHEKVNADDSVPTGPPPVEEVDICLSANYKPAPGFEGSPSYQPENMCEVDKRVDLRANESSVHPFPSPESSWPKESRRSGSLTPNFLRRLLMPIMLPCYPQSPPRHSINVDNLTEILNNNIMHVNNNATSQERGRHPTAPSSDIEDETEKEGGKELLSGSTESLEDFSRGRVQTILGTWGFKL